MTAYVHDGFGQVIQQTSPDTGVTVFTHDTAGRRTQRTDARGVVTGWTYDDLGRVTAMNFPASPAENVAYAYDATTPGHYGIGRMASVTDDSGSTVYRHDARGNIVRVETVVGAQTYVTEYGYDLADRMIQMVYPSGRIVDYARDAIGRVIDVSTRANLLATPVALAAGATYEAFGGLDALAYGNGVTLALGHDLNGRMVAMDAFNGLTPVLDLDYTFDLAGNITDIDDIGLGNRGRNFAYDNLHRLTQGQELASGGTPVTLQTDYTYDAVGNRLTRNAGGALDTLAYDAFSNKLDTVTVGATVRTLGYGASGNTASDDDGLGTVLTHTYDATDRLAEIKQGAATVASYLHNAAGQRVAKTVGAAVTHYVYDLGGNLIAEADGGTGAATAEYIALEGKPLAYIATGSIYWVHADHLGTPQVLTDAAAAVVWDADYRPFGEATVSGALTFNLRFPGQYADAETGLHYNYFRDYDPTTGRYIQSDPIGLRGGWNTYGYVGGNPTRFYDRFGLKPDPVCVAAYQAGGVVIGATGGYMCGAAVGGFFGTAGGPAGTIGGGLGGGELGGMGGAAAGLAAGGLLGNAMCPDEDDTKWCDKELEKEETRCWDMYGSVWGAGDWRYVACMERAFASYVECRMTGNWPRGRQWDDPDVDGMPKPPRKRKK